MNKNTALNAEFNRKAIYARISTLLGKLAQLAPHPDQQGCAAPLFISLASHFKPAADYDATLGSLIMENYLGSAFFEAASNDNSALLGGIGMIDNNALEAAVEFLQEREKANGDTHNNYGHGRGSITLYERDTVHNNFNKKAERALLENAYLNDLQQRLKIEGQIARLAKEYNELELDYAA